ncbi:MAG TPA: PolC-type DNA polymerase III N-terminal domain-containing protein, partial [Rummeliibacillus sp.]|nr:PolC-type DNA polymerase III N-terminal domain-containing protein [Rummeliibacillus sp.]
MANEQDSKLKFQLLLQQINMTEDVFMPFFEAAEMTRVTVHKKDRVWRLSLKLQNILPFQVYQ